MTVTFDFAGRTAVVSGAAQGIGLALAQMFSNAGARVAVADWDGEQLAARWGTATDTVLPIRLNVADASAVERAVDQVVDWSEGIDIVVNNAGIALGITVSAISPSAATSMVAAMPPDKLEQVEASIPMGRIVSADEICSRVGFLASEEAGYITGVVLPVDGGLAV
jgi:3-oxoacyl-[acyl-carrier protein] reductase